MTLLTGTLIRLNSTKAAKRGLVSFSNGADNERRSPPYQEVHVRQDVFVALEEVVAVPLRVLAMVEIRPLAHHLKLGPVA
jgi:hypothetical protein